MKTVTVVCSLIHDAHGRVLMARRSADADRPSMWEYSGGKVEGDEAERTALVRELREELGIQVRVGRLVSVCNIEFEIKARLLLYHCVIAKGQLTPITAVELEWFFPQEAIKNLPMLPTAYLFYEDIREFLEGVER